MVQGSMFKVQGGAETLNFELSSEAGQVQPPTREEKGDSP